MMRVPAGRRFASVLSILCLTPVATSAGQAPGELWSQVEVIRTAHGVPHIRAENLRAGGYALAWLQLEDYGPETAMNVLWASARMGAVFGHDSIESDFSRQRARATAVAGWPSLDDETREFYQGFAAGVNRYVALHPAEFPPGMPTDFTGFDAAALDVGVPSGAAVRAFLARLFPPAPGRGGRAGGTPPDEDASHAQDDVGSNAWAFAPSRTRSGKAILLRNPHLAWSAGYYEAHLTVPGVVDFYGDFRIGGAFAVIGGFNRDLGFATTNNAQDLEEIYALEADTTRVDHYLLDGTSFPLEQVLTTVAYRTGAAMATETRETWRTILGPVIARANGKVYIVRSTHDGEFRGGMQFLRMMRARSLGEWKDAMRLQARASSNFTYADRAGNIFYVWNARLPVLPHSPGEDTTAIPVRSSNDVWTRIVPFDSLPQFLNPKGGYVHNENSSPHFTNVREPIDTTNAWPNFEPPSLSLRSQLSLQLIDTNRKLSLEDVVTLKHNYRMLLADRVKPDLIRAVRATQPTGDVAAALALLEKWDNTASPDSKGSSLFELWWARYAQRQPDSLRYATTWSSADPLRTPGGLADPARAAESFSWAVEEATTRFGAWDVAWGDVHRVRRGDVDVPVGGCSGALGCFRVLAFAPDSGGTLTAAGGDGWILAVEFGDVPRAYSVLAYGVSSRPESPWHADQAEMFARGQLKRVAFAPADVDAGAVLRYRPGERAVRR